MDSLPVPAERPALLYVSGGSENWTATNADASDLSHLSRRDRALLRALLTLALDGLDRSEASEVRRA